MQCDPMTLHYRYHSQGQTLFTIPSFIMHQVCGINFHHLYFHQYLSPDSRVQLWTIYNPTRPVCIAYIFCCYHSNYTFKFAFSGCTLILALCCYLCILYLSRYEMLYKLHNKCLELLEALIFIWACRMGQN